MTRTLGWTRVALCAGLSAVALSIGQPELELRFAWVTTASEVAMLAASLAVLSGLALRVEGVGRLSGLADLTAAPLWIALALAGDAVAALYVAPPLLALRGAVGVVSGDPGRLRSVRGVAVGLSAAMLLTGGLGGWRWLALAVAVAIESWLHWRTGSEREARMVLAWLQLVGALALVALTVDATRFEHARTAMAVSAGVAGVCGALSIVELVGYWRERDGD